MNWEFGLGLKTVGDLVLGFNSKIQLNFLIYKFIFSDINDI